MKQAIWRASGGWSAGVLTLLVLGSLSLEPALAAQEPASAAAPVASPTEAAPAAEAPAPQVLQPAGPQSASAQSASAPAPVARHASARRSIAYRRRHGHSAHAVVPALAGDPRHDLPEGLALRSNAAYLVDESSQEVLAGRNPDQVQPIASITKLMTAVVVLQQGVPLDELVEISDADVDNLRHTHSLLRVGSRYSRRDLLLLALMSSENRAAAALGRSLPEGREAFVEKMNATARQLGMTHTHYEDTSGLNGGNLSSARDLALLVRFAATLPLIHEFTTTPEARVAAVGGRSYLFRNTNLLVRQGEWDVVVSKTGFINESGQCLVMQARIDRKLTTIVLLDSRGHLSRITDAQRVRKWLEARAAAAQSRLGDLSRSGTSARRPNAG